MYIPMCIKSLSLILSTFHNTAKFGLPLTH